MNLILIIYLYYQTILIYFLIFVLRGPNYEYKSDISSTFKQQINNEYYKKIINFIIKDKNINIGDDINIKLIKLNIKIECHFNGYYNNI